MKSDDKAVVIPVTREDARVERQRVETGVVRVRKTVRERVEQIDEPMLHDEVDVEHVPLNRPVASPEPPREEDGVLIVPVYEEVIRVQRQWVLREEIRLRRRQVRTHHREELTLREEEARVSRHGPDAAED